MDDELNTLILQIAKDYEQELDPDFVDALVEQIIYEFIPENYDVDVPDSDEE